MNRPGDRYSIERLISKVREKVPGITVRTTLIAGFPGETEEQFEELCQFVKDMRFDRLGCFAYSQEEGTKAAQMEGQWDEITKEKRANKPINRKIIKGLENVTKKAVTKLCR